MHALFAGEISKRKIQRHKIGQNSRRFQAAKQKRIQFVKNNFTYRKPVKKIWALGKRDGKPLYQDKREKSTSLRIQTDRPTVNLFAKCDGKNPMDPDQDHNNYGEVLLIPSFR